MKKRILSIMVTAALCVGGMTVSVSAANTDVTTAGALQGAIDAAGEGDTITLKGEIVLTGGITLNKKVTVKADANAVVKVSGTTQAFTMSNGAVIDGLTIEKTDSADQTICYMQANTKVLNSKFTGKYTAGASEVSRAIVTAGAATGLEIAGNAISGLRQPAYIEGGTTGKVENNSVSGTRGWVVCGDSNMTFSNNTFADNAVDIAIIPNTPNGTNLYAGKVAAFSETNDGAYVENQIAGVSAQDGSYFVEAGKANADLAKTLKEVKDGDTILVKNGTYDGNFTIDKSVTLTAAEGAKPVFSGMVSTKGEDVTLNGLTFLPANSNKIAIYPSAGSLTVDGCTFGAKDTETFSAVYNESPMKSLTFVNNTLNGSFRKALLAHPTEKAVISGNAFVGGGDSYAGEAGKTSVMTIVATEDTAVTVKDNEVSNYHKMLSVDNSKAQGAWEIKENKIVDVNYALEMSSEKDFTYDISGNYFEQEGKATEPAVMDAETGEAYAGEAVVTGPYYQDEDMKQLSDKVYGVTLDKTSLTLKPGETATLTATVDAGVDADKTVTWSTSDAQIATVENGKVTALKDGKVTITAKAGDVTVTCEITVAADKPAVSEPDTDTPDTGVAFPAAVLLLAAGAAAALVISKKSK